MEKASIVLDIGGSYTKCGYTGESTPRCIVPTDLHPFNLSQYLSSGISYDHTTTDNNNNNNLIILPTAQQLTEPLLNFLNTLFLKYLLCKPEQKKIVIVENLFVPRMFRQLLVSLLFDHFKVQSIVLLSPTVSLLPLLRTTAVIIDCGYSESRVYEGIGMMSAYKTARVGSKTIRDQLKKSLMDDLANRTVVSNTLTRQPLEQSQARSIIESLTSQQLEDILIKTTVLALDPTSVTISNIEYHLTPTTSLSISSQQRSHICDALFHDPNVEQDCDGVDEENIVTLLLDSLIQCDIDMTKSLAHSLLLIGGTGMLPGFKAKLIQQVKKRLDEADDDSIYSQLKGLTNHLEFIDHQYQPNYFMWLGASLAGTFDTYTTHRLTHDQYTRGNKRLPEYERCTINSTK
ncbi:hypothetical protein SAMD00019534_005470 [Acytostelium subglobosum LB1]|uniref:hypothetical protein n=1 Tax=Acytostelium subglobosum LB1 TaxID=1410327 RepID=UPI00064507A9|nr:hypothetical protein SAMD00019534_005470 [Acytostelium subglobosum LB1]GAM17372.1 hypothetical protein SAMD00019534_005470 [Acytostelium subglobosum LB1]|eukprot:XP_012759434.1 hypothetical protein SAMD00019534_005470 [Acytostelium subglobosum LB1]